MTITIYDDGGWNPDQQVGIQTRPDSTPTLARGVVYDKESNNEALLSQKIEDTIISHL